MGTALIVLLVGLGALAAGILLGRYYVPDDRQLRRTARHSRAYMRALSHLISRDHEAVIEELRTVVEESVDDVEPYFALGAMFRSRGEHERAIRVHQALAVRERDRKKLRQRAMYELGLDFRAAGMPRRATKAMEAVLVDDAAHEGALRALAALYEEQARFNEAAGLWQRLGRRRNEDTSVREHHLLVAAAQAALGRADHESARQLLKAAHKQDESAHYFAAAAELAAATGDHRAALACLAQALLADPALAPHLLPGLLASEQAVATLDAGEVSMTTALIASGPADAGSLVPAERASASVATRVLDVLAETERMTGPRLEIDLIRAQLVPSTDAAQRAAVASDLVARFPDALAAKVATAQLALHTGDAAEVRRALELLVADSGALAWALRGRWQCAHCGHRPGPFSWRCGQCRRWASLRMETGIDPPPAPPRERRASTRTSRPDSLLGLSPDEALPAPTLDVGLSEDELARAGARRSLLGRMGGWFSGAWRRDADP